MRKKLKLARIEKELSQQDMADKLGIALKTYNLKEQGKANFNDEEIKKILEILEKKYEELF